MNLPVVSIANCNWTSEAADPLWPLTKKLWLQSRSTRGFSAIPPALNCNLILLLWRSCKKYIYLMVFLASHSQFHWDYMEHIVIVAIRKYMRDVTCNIQIIALKLLLVHLTFFSPIDVKKEIPFVLTTFSTLILRVTC